MGTAYLGIGSNMGDRLATLRWARRRLAEIPGVTQLAASSLYATEPVGGPPGQAAFLNAVLQLETTLDPAGLWRQCERIEQEAGRARTIRNGPRTLDLDLLLFGDRCLQDADLTLPHPRLHLRRFVLVPLCDLAPRLIHPLLGRSMQELLEKLAGNGVERLRKDW